MYPINLILSDRPVVVIGGGPVAQRKVLTLLEAEADVTVIAPELTELLQQMADENKFSWLKRKYRRGDLQGYYLGICAVDDDITVAEVSAEAEERKLLLNVVNDQSKCTFTVPAKLERGDMLLTVATGGKSPAMAKYLKNYLGRLIPESYGDWIHRVEMLRSEAIASIPTARGREEFWRSVLDEEIMVLVEAGEFRQAEEKIRNAISSFRLKS